MSGPIDSYYEVNEGTGCWEWTGYRHVQGYGYKSDVRFGKSPIRAHRWMYLLLVGPIPEGMGVLHSCDVPYCANPDHLRVGTHQENMDDMNRRGRHGGMPGTKHPRAKVDDDDVREIRKLAAAGMSSREIGERYGIAGSTVSHIRVRRTWRHVT